MRVFVCCLCDEKSDLRPTKMNVEDHHSIYVMAQGYTEEEVRSQVDAWVHTPAVQQALLENDASDHYILSLATNHENVFLGFGYIYCTSPALYHMLLGRQPTGLHGILVQTVPPQPYTPVLPVWDGTRPKRVCWADETDKEFPEPTLQPCDSLIANDTFIRLKAAHIPFAAFTNCLRVWSVPDHITAKDIWACAIPYASQVDVFLCRERNEACLVFSDLTYDANFASFFLRKVMLDDGTVLVFRPLRPDESRPVFKDAEHYPNL